MVSLDVLVIPEHSCPRVVSFSTDNVGIEVIFCRVVFVKDSNRIRWTYTSSD